LRNRLAEYSQMGARFAKWRAVFAVGHGIPSRACIEANAQALARYAALCQEAGLVPVVEPEVLMDGGHTLERCCEVHLTKKNYAARDLRLIQLNDYEQPPEQSRCEPSLRRRLMIAFQASMIPRTSTARPIEMAKSRGGMATVSKMCCATGM